MGVCLDAKENHENPQTGYISAEIRTEYVLNTSLDHYRNANQRGANVLMSVDSGRGPHKA